MSPIETEPHGDMAETMRELLGEMHGNDYSNLDELRQFITLYNLQGTLLDGDDPNAHLALMESLDIPEIGLEFGEATFDDIVGAYDDLGGSRSDLQFPDTGREPSADWSEELDTLTKLFSDEYKEEADTMNLDILYARTNALYVRNHLDELIAADPDGEKLKVLLAKPNFLKALSEVYSFGGYGDLDEGGDLEKDEDKKLINKTLHAIAYRFADSFIEDWQFNSMDQPVLFTLPKNLERMAELEKNRLGATEFLSSSYGIRHFDRYPSELLIDQIDAHGDTSRPYGLIIGGVDDHNGAFSSAIKASDSVPLQLYEQARETHVLRVIESASETELRERLAFIDALYGDHQKVEFSMLRGHGSRTSIALGRSLDIGALALDSDFKKERKIFKAGSPMVLDSCSTGQINGMAQALSRSLEVVTIAPQLNAGVTTLTFVRGYDGLRMVPRFVHGTAKDEEVADAAVYKNGSPLGRKKTDQYLSI